MVLFTTEKEGVMRHVTHGAATIALAISLVSCGGGGGGDGGSAPPAAPIGNIAGTWTITETAKTANNTLCQPPASPLEVFNLTVAQNGNSVTVTDAQNNVFTGTISGNALSWTGSYPDGAGTTTLNPMSSTIDASCNSLSGTATWTYAEIGFSCSGTTTFTGTRSPASGCGGTTPPPGGAIAEVEPNDTPGQAQVIASLPATITGTVSNNTDIDAFRITLATARTLTITMSGPTTQDADLVVWDSTGNTVLGASVNADSNESVTISLAAGTYLVTAFPFDITAPAPYTINIP
jgi:hypothetical protein